MYRAKDFSYLLGMPGFDSHLLKLHFTLYQGYVNNTNKLLKEFESMDRSSVCFAELKRRFGWEFSGMRLHEYYFENLGSQPMPRENNQFFEWINHCFGDMEQWEADFKAIGLMRGIGWAVLYRDNRRGNLMNCWIEQHDTAQLAGCQPLLAMDIWEHAYLCQYGLDKKAYIENFFKNINWECVLKRFSYASV